MNAAPGDFAETVLMPGDPLPTYTVAEYAWNQDTRELDTTTRGGVVKTFERYDGTRELEKVSLLVRAVHLGALAVTGIQDPCEFLLGWV